MEDISLWENQQKEKEEDNKHNGRFIYLKRPFFKLYSVHEC